MRLIYLYKKNVISPFIPLNKDNFDYKYCNAIEKQGLKTQERYSIIILRDDYKFIFNDYYYFNRYFEVIENVFENIHEIIYKDNYKKESEDNNSTNYSFKNIKQESLMSFRTSLTKKKNLKNLNNEFITSNIQLYENFKSHRQLKKKNYIHIRATSALSVTSNQAFFEANNYIKDRKMKRNQSLINNILSKDNNNNNLIPLNSKNLSIENNEFNHQNNFRKTMIIS